MLVESEAIAEEGGRWAVEQPHEVDRVPSAIRRLIAARLDGSRTTRSACSKTRRQPAMSRRPVCFSTSTRARIVVPRCVRSRRAISSVVGEEHVPGETEFAFKHALIRDVGTSPYRRPRELAFT